MSILLSQTDVHGNASKQKYKAKSYTKTRKHKRQGHRDLRVNHIKVIEREGFKKSTQVMQRYHVIRPKGVEESS